MERQQTAKPIKTCSPSRSHIQAKSAVQKTAALHPVLQLQWKIGNQAVQRLIQAKLRVGRPGDQYEQEADQVAVQVMRMPGPANRNGPAMWGRAEPLRIQRVCSECEEELRRQPEEEEEDEPIQAKPISSGHSIMQRQEEIEEDKENLQTKSPTGNHSPLIQRQVEPGEDEEETLQTKEAPGQIPEVAADSEARTRSLRGHGQPLSESVRAFFEPRFGYNFSQVRAHTDAEAAQSARAVNARAFTVGRDIIFGTGEFAPTTQAGKVLLAHELTHVLQQEKGMAGTSSMVSSAGFSHGPQAKWTAHPTDSKGGAQSRRISSPLAIRPSPMQLQRLTRRTRVRCPAGQNPHSADRRASRLLENAIDRTHAARAYRTILPNDPDVLAVRSALWRAFRLNPNRERTWTRLAPIIQRRLEIVKDYINSVVFRFICIAAGAAHNIPPCVDSVTCGPIDRNAASCPDNPTDIMLCPPFWRLNLDRRGGTLVHEVIHLNFGWGGDWAEPDFSNPHCYVQFVLLLNGITLPEDQRCH